MINQHAIMDIIYSKCYNGVIMVGGFADGADSARFFRQCLAEINFGPNVRVRIVLVADLRGVKDGT